ncbi:hypothetical protein ACOSP7_007935 [Xanthoceras sorbifolium]
MGKMNLNLHDQLLTERNVLELITRSSWICLCRFTNGKADSALLGNIYVSAVQGLEDMETLCRGRLVLPKRIIKKVLQSQRKDVNVLSSNSTRPDAGTILLTPRNKNYVRGRFFFATINLLLLIYIVMVRLPEVLLGQ